MSNRVSHNRGESMPALEPVSDVNACHSPSPNQSRSVFAQLHGNDPFESVSQAGCVGKRGFVNSLPNFQKELDQKVLRSVFLAFGSISLFIGLLGVGSLLGSSIGLFGFSKYIPITQNSLNMLLRNNLFKIGFVAGLAISTSASLLLSAVGFVGDAYLKNRSRKFQEIFQELKVELRRIDEGRGESLKNQLIEETCAKGRVERDLARAEGDLREAQEQLAIVRKENAVMKKKMGDARILCRYVIRLKADYDALSNLHRNVLRSSLREEEEEEEEEGEGLVSGASNDEGLSEMSAASGGDPFIVMKEYLEYREEITRRQEENLESQRVADDEDDRSRFEMLASTHDIDICRSIGSLTSSSFLEASIDEHEDDE